MYIHLLDLTFLNILELIYDLKQLLTVTSILLFISIIILEKEWLRYMKLVFHFSFLNRKTNGRFGTRMLFICCKTFFVEKNFFTEKNVNENVKNIYLIWKIIFLYRKCLFYKQKYKSFWNIYSFCKKNVLIMKNIFELNNLVLKVSEAPNLWYSLN